jgi:acetyltransferase-like isoleucine patch superfamily enzyme
MIEVGMLKRALKTALSGASLLVAFPPAAVSAFGRWTAAYELFAHVYALAPGLLGDYLRIAYYKLTLAECSLSSRISFGSFFPHPVARVGPHVYIGPYCIVGIASIGERTQIASGVQILSGRHQHSRGAAGGLSGARRDAFSAVTIGADCWIGAGAIIMADVGAGSTIGAGSVVSRPIPPLSVAVGSPARVIEQASEAAGH